MDRISQLLLLSKHQEGFKAYCIHSPECPECRGASVSLSHKQPGMLSNKMPLEVGGDFRRSVPDSLRAGKGPQLRSRACAPHPDLISTLRALDWERLLWANSWGGGNQCSDSE